MLWLRHVQVGHQRLIALDLQAHVAQELPARRVVMHGALVVGNFGGQLHERRFEGSELVHKRPPHERGRRVHHGIGGRRDAGGKVLVGGFECGEMTGGIVAGIQRGLFFGEPFERAGFKQHGLHLCPHRPVQPVGAYREAAAQAGLLLMDATGIVDVVSA